MEEIIVQALSIIVAIITFISYQVKTNKTLMFLQALSNAIVCVSYFLLGATSGFVLNVVGLMRNLTLYFLRDKQNLSITFGFIFAIIVVVLGIKTWHAWYSAFIVVALFFNSIALSLCRPQVLRASILFTSSSIFVYNAFVFSIGAMANEVIAITSSIIGLIRYRKPRVKKEDYSERLIQTQENEISSL